LQYDSFGLYITDGRNVTMFRNKNLLSRSGYTWFEKSFFSRLQWMGTRQLHDQ